MYLLHGKLNAQAGQAAALADILLAASQLVATAAGCRLFAVGKDVNAPNAVYVTELWTDQAAHDASLQVPGVRELIAQAMPLLDGAPSKGQALEILGGAGL